jgi:hypothetical protein
VRRADPDEAPWPRHRPFTTPAKKVLERTLRAALADESKEITADHVLLGLAGGDDVVGRELAARGAGPAQLRAWLAAHPI